MSATRRDFLRSAGLSIMAGAAGFLSADQFVAAADDFWTKDFEGLKDAGDASDPKARKDASRQKPTLVTIFLRGGADSLNAFAPIGDPLYYQYRPRIALREKGKKDEKGTLKIFKTDYFGLNPAFASLAPLFEEGQAVPILNTGSPDGTRSHFSAQDNMERACGDDSSATMQGWLNRYLELSRKPYDAPLRGLSAMTLLPRALRGDYPVLAGDNRTDRMEAFEEIYARSNLVNMNAREGGPGDSGSRLDQRPVAKARDAGKKLLTADMTRDIITASGTHAVERIKALEQAQGAENTVGYPGGGLGNQLAAIARVIKANVGLEVAQADYDGWDHHSGQGGVYGNHSNMLRYLSDSIAAFHQDLGPRMNKVMVLVMSEFGRTVHDNGANGTDHGHGGFMLAVGNMLNGGKFYGKHTDLRDLAYERFQPVHTDFRAVFAEAVARLFSFDPYKAGLFPGYTGTPKDLLGYMKQVKQV